MEASVGEVAAIAAARAGIEDSSGCGSVVAAWGGFPRESARAGRGIAASGDCRRGEPPIEVAPNFPSLPPLLINKRRRGMGLLGNYIWGSMGCSSSERKRPDGRN
jgi:hypothetical protein